MLGTWFPSVAPLQIYHECALSQPIQFVACTDMTLDVAMTQNNNKQIMYMKSSFPKWAKRHFRKWACRANAKFNECVLVKRFSHMYICIFTYIHIYIHIYEAFFFTTWSPNFALALRHQFWRLTRFGKELFIYVYIWQWIWVYINTYTRVCTCICTCNIYIWYISIMRDCRYRKEPLLPLKISWFHVIIHR